MLPLTPSNITCGRKEGTTHPVSSFASGSQFSCLNSDGPAPRPLFAPAPPAHPPTDPDNTPWGSRLCPRPHLAGQDKPHRHRDSGGHPGGALGVNVLPEQAGVLFLGVPEQ